MLGRELNRLFIADEDVLALDAIEPTFPRRKEYQKISDAFISSSFPVPDRDARYALDYIRLVIQRLLHPTVPKDARYYESAAEAANDLSKLQREFGAAQNIAELQTIPQHVLRLPSCGNAPLTRRVKTFLNSTPARRLTRHLQLGVVRQVYPGATHLRFEHLFGVLVRATQYVRALYADRNDPFWRIAIEQRDVDALLTAALLHDIGHIAIGHALEQVACMKTT